MATLFLGACGGSGDDRTEISLLVFGEPAEMQVYRDLVEAFHAAEPEIRVRLIETGSRSDLLTRLATSFAGGVPPDLFLINYRFYGSYAARNVLEPLGDRLAASTRIHEEDYFPQALDAFRFRGRLVCMPQNVSSLVVYFNRDLFRAAGVEPPTPGWTWTDMVERASELTRDLDGDGRIDQYGLGVEPTLVRLAPFVWSNGGEIVDDEEDPTRLTLGDPGAVEALFEFVALQRVHRVTPPEEEAEAEDDETRFAAGRSAMVMSSRRATPSFRATASFDWDVAPLPVHRQPAGVLHSDGYCMARHSRAKDESWRFVEFAVGPAGQRITATAGRTVPSLTSVARSPAFLDPARRPRSGHVFLDGIQGLRRLPSVPVWPQVEESVDAVLEQGMYELEQPAAEIAAEIERRTAPLLARGRG